MPNHRDSKDATGRLTAKGVVGQPSVAIKFNGQKSPMLRGIEPPLENGLTRNFGGFYCSSVFGLRRYVTEATDD